MKNTFMTGHVMRALLAILLIMSMLLCGCETKDAEEASGGNNATDDGKIDGGKQDDPLTDGKEENIEIKNAIDGITGIYGTFMDSIGAGKESSSGVGYEMELELTLGEQVMAMLEMALIQQEIDISIDWFESLGIEMEAFSEEGLMQIVSGIKLNGRSVLTLDAIMDLAGAKTYVALPELNSQYIYTEIDPDEAQMDYQSLAADYADLIKALPTEEEVGLLLDRYADLMLESIDEPATTEETLSYYDITQKVKAKTYEISKKQALDMVTAALNAMKTDKELKSVIDDFCLWYNAENKKAAAAEGYTWTEVDLHADMLESIQELTADIEDEKAELEDGIFMKLAFYSADSEQVGFRLDLNDGYESVAVYAYSLASKDDTAIVFNYNDMIVFEGSHTVDGGKADGEYEIEAEGEELFYITIEDCDIEAWENGELKGTIAIELGDAVMEELTEVSAMDISVELDLDIDADKSEITAAIYMNDMLVATLKLDGKEIDAQKIKIPSNAVDSNDEAAVEKWAEKLDFNKIISNLRGADVPEEILNLLIFLTY